MTMYYNLTSEERYILTLSDTMLKEGYTVDEVVEFLQCEDMDQVECILGTLTESTDCLLYTSPSPRDATLSRMPSSA